MSSKAKIAAMIWQAARKAYRKDRANRYALREPWTLPVLDLDLPAYDGPYIQVQPLGFGQSQITVKPFDGDICDGATLAPDSPRGVIPAALFHDPWYLEIAAIAAAWGWTEKAVRNLGDDILSTVILRAGGEPLIARIYYNWVWYLGGAFRSVSRLLHALCIALALASLGGCSGGCLAPPDHSDPASPYTPPVYEQTA